MCVCIYIYTNTHIHIYIYEYEYVGCTIWLQISDGVYVASSGHAFYPSFR